MEFGINGTVQALSRVLGALLISACLTAPVALLTRKGSAIHRAAGRVYLALISLTALLAVGLGFFQGDVFVAAVSLFSLQAVLSGIRSLRLKGLREGQRVSHWDWLTTLLFLAFNSGMVFVGLRDTLELSSIEDIALMVVGAVGLVLSFANLWKYQKPPRAPWYWFSEHIAAMLASYAAALTAFSATYLTVLPLFWRILWPSLVIAPVLAAWVAVYERRFAEGIQPRDVAEVREEAASVLRFSDE